MKRFLWVGLVFFSWLVSSPATAATFSPHTSDELQSALTTAGGNTENDIINLDPTTYHTNQNGAGASFTFTSSLSHSLTINGSTSGASILDGDDGFQVLSLQTTGASGSFTLNHLTLQNGANPPVPGGAGLYISVVNGPVLLEDCRILNNDNTVNTGAGFFIDGTAGTSAVRIQNSLVSGNRTLNPVMNAGGGKVETQGAIQFNHNQVLQNYSEQDVGGVSLVGTGITVEGNTISDNQAMGSAGGVSLQLEPTASGNILFTKNTLFDNRSLGAQAGGGAIQNDAATQILFINNILADNSAPDDVGGMAIRGGDFVSVINNTVFNNSAGDAVGGLFLAPMDFANLNVYNNILFGNQSAPLRGQDAVISDSVAPNAVVKLFNNDFSQICFDGAMSCSPVSVLGADQGSNINADPRFMNFSIHDFQLRLDSPTIDSGDPNAPNLPAQDQAGDPRVSGGQVDMGALETFSTFGVDPTSIDFGELPVGATNLQVLTIRNQGFVPIEITAVSPSSERPFAIDFNGGPNPCNASRFILGVDESCSLAAEFSPQSSGNFDAILTLNSNDPALPFLEILLTGIGTSLNPATKGGCALGASAPAMSTLALGVLPLIWVLWRRLKSR